MSTETRIVWVYLPLDNTGYLFQRSTDSGSSWPVEVTITSSLVHDYLDTNVSLGGTYYYRVAATNDFGTSSFSNVATVHVPDVLPLAPIGLAVSSGSAILTWSSGSNNQNFFTVQESVNNVNFFEIATTNASTLTYTDTAVSGSIGGNTYYYKVAAINTAGTSSFSNTGIISFALPAPPPAFCQAPAFSPVAVSSTTTSPIAFTQVSPGSGSLNVWARSTAFNTKINVYDPSNVLVGTNTGNGWTPSGDVSDSALSVSLASAGNYSVQLSSSNGSYAGGNYVFKMMPGVNKLTTLVSNRRYPTFISSISGSPIMAIAGGQGQVSFYNIANNTVTTSFTNGNYGGFYSKPQDRYFVPCFSSSANVVLEFDRDGNFVTANSLTYTFGGTACYDEVNDRIFITRTNSPGGQWGIWDCASRTVIQTGTITPQGQGSTYCTYVNANNRYYIGAHIFSNNNGAMVWVDASTYANGTTTTQMHDFLQYDPNSKQIAATANQGIILIDPLTDTITKQVTSNANHQLEGAAYDPCSQTLVLAVDFSGGLFGGLICLDPSSSFSPANFYSLSDNNNGIYMYGVAHSQYTSKMYVGTDNASFAGSALWDCKVTYPL
jgi:hypothetical protein